MTKDEIIQWARTYEPKVKEFRLSQSSYIDDSKKYLDSLSSMLEKNKENPTFDSCYLRLCQAKEILEDLEKNS